jgi:hypothetical protein
MQLARSATGQSLHSTHTHTQRNKYLGVIHEDCPRTDQISRTTHRLTRVLLSYDSYEDIIT